MDKKTTIILAVIGAVIILLVALAFGLEGKSQGLTSEDIMRINNDIYKRAEFEDFIKYTLYKNNGEIAVDEENYAEELANGTSREELFVNDTLNSYYQLKVFKIIADNKKVSLDQEEIDEMTSEYEENKTKITSIGLTENSYIELAKQDAIQNKIASAPDEYLELPDGVYDEYIGQFSGDDLKSYTYRMIQVSYEPDKVSGEESGEFIPGNRAEKETYMNSIVERLNNGEDFETVSESGDNRIIWVGNGLQFAKSLQEYSAGMLLEQKIGEDLAKEFIDAESGKLTDVVDTGNEFQIALVEKVEDGVVGKAKDELISLMISQYSNDLIYAYVKDVEVNNAALSRVKVK